MSSSYRPLQDSNHSFLEIRYLCEKKSVNRFNILFTLILLKKKWTAEAVHGFRCEPDTTNSWQGTHSQGCPSGTYHTCDGPIRTTPRLPKRSGHCRFTRHQYQPWLPYQNVPCLNRPNSNEPRLPNLPEAIRPEPQRAISDQGCRSWPQHTLHYRDNPCRSPPRLPDHVQTFHPLRKILQRLLALRQTENHSYLQ